MFGHSDGNVGVVVHKIEQYDGTGIVQPAVEESVCMEITADVEAVRHRDRCIKIAFIEWERLIVLGRQFLAVESHIEVIRNRSGLDVHLQVVADLTQIAVTLVHIEAQQIPHLVVRGVDEVIHDIAPLFRVSQCHGGHRSGDAINCQCVSFNQDSVGFLVLGGASRAVFYIAYCVGEVRPCPRLEIV